MYLLEKLEDKMAKSKPVNRRQITIPGSLIVRKDNNLIRAKINLGNIMSARILAALIAEISTNTTEFKTVYQIPVSKLNLDNKQLHYELIEEACTALLHCSIISEYFNENHPEEPDWEGMVFCTHVKYQNGIITAKFYEGIAPYLLALTGNYTKYNLLEYITLPSTYSQRIFEILKSYDGLPYIILNLEILQNQLNCPITLKGNFKDFRIRVLEKAEQDINNLTSLRFTWEAIKTGRRVTNIKFTFIKTQKTLPVSSSSKLPQTLLDVIQERFPGSNFMEVRNLQTQLLKTKKHLSDLKSTNIKDALKELGLTFPSK